MDRAEPQTRRASHGSSNGMSAKCFGLICGMNISARVSIQILDDADVAFRISGTELRPFYPRPPCLQTGRTA
jgi:hypothetical protein